jgi:hypothetical protein
MARTFSSNDLWMEAVPRKIWFTDIFLVLKFNQIFRQIQFYDSNQTPQNLKILKNSLITITNIVKIIMISLEYGRPEGNLSFDSISQNLYDNSLYFYFNLLSNLEGDLSSMFPNASQT